MAKDIYFYDTLGNRRRVKEVYFYDTNGNRRKVKECYFYDTNGNRRQYFSSGLSPSAANFTLNNASALSDTNEGSVYGIGWGSYGLSNDNGFASTTPPNPPAVGGVGGARCLFTTNGNSGDVGLPPNLIIYGTVLQTVPNTDASFASMFVAGIGTFNRANATYYPNGANSQGSEWHWVHNGPFFNVGASHVVQFT